MKHLLYIVFVCFACLQGCADGGVREEWVSRIETAHTTADTLLEDGDREGFERTLENALLVRHDGVAAIDLRLVHQDIYFRLAESALARGDAKKALHWVQTGLELGGNQDLFRANLFVVQGKAYESLGKTSEANQAFYEALLINDTLFTQLVDHAK